MTRPNMPVPLQAIILLLQQIAARMTNAQGKYTLGYGNYGSYLCHCLSFQFKYG